MTSRVPPPSDSRFRIDGREVHLWYTGVGGDGEIPGDLLGRYEALLPPDERARYLALRVPHRRREYLVTRALARCVLSRYYPEPPGAWRFRIAAHGKPELDPPRALQFNLTNCAGLVACAVADGRVGIDAEPLSRAPAVLGLARRFLADAEREALSRLGAERRAERALSLWTLKEAYVKARGLGLTLPLRSFSFAFESGRAALVAPPPCDDARWDFATAGVRAHKVALAFERTTGQPRALRAFEATPLAGEPREVDPLGP